MSTAPADTSLGQTEREIIALMAGAVQMLDLPKSLGEIYGLLYVCEEPLCMDDIIKRLGISLGTASQGLKQLRAFRAVRTVEKPGRRCDYYEPETELRRLLGNILREQLQPRLDSGQEKLRQLKDRLRDEPDSARQAHLRQRVDKLFRWHANASRLLPLLGALMKT